MDNNILNNDNIQSEKQIQTIEILEKERKRIAADLHDTTLQNLTHVLHQLELSEMYLGRDLIKSKLELLSARNNLKSVVAEIRNLIFDLRPMPFDDLGLKVTFESLIDNVRKSYSFQIDALIDDIKVDNQYVMISIYRIGKEALMNALNHSEGNKITFKCVMNTGVINLLIKDNGKGFIQESIDKESHYGLQLMRERVSILNGTMQIMNNNGTEINISIPVDNC